MARLLHLAIVPTFTPAYWAMLETVTLIAERRGEEGALQWFQRQLDESFELFCELHLDRTPALRLIRGDRA